MLSEPRTQMRGRPELSAAMFCDVAGGCGGQGGKQVAWCLFVRPRHSDSLGP